MMRGARGASLMSATEDNSLIDQRTGMRVPATWLTMCASAALALLLAGCIALAIGATPARIGFAVFTMIFAAAVLATALVRLGRNGAARAASGAVERGAGGQLDTEVDRTAELSELSHHLIRVSEEEKARLARELHDTLGSNLTAINMDLNWINKRLPPERPELRERLQRSLHLLAETVELKHEVIEGLRPSNLDNLGLAHAMRSHCREFTRRTGLPCEVQVDEDFDDLDPNWAIALYRIAQESLTNVTRHAAASSVSLHLVRETAGIRLRIIDDGRGMPAGTASSRISHGVLGMRERMRQVGGSVTFGSADPGTVVDAFIPVSTPQGN